MCFGGRGGGSNKAALARAWYVGGRAQRVFRYHIRHGAQWTPGSVARKRTRELCASALVGTRVIQGRHRPLRVQCPAATHGAAGNQTRRWNLKRAAGHPAGRKPFPGTWDILPRKQWWAPRHTRITSRASSSLLGVHHI